MEKRAVPPSFLYNCAMVRNAILRLTAPLLFGLTLHAAEAPPPASEILDHAKTAAVAEHKAILLIFHASWCGYCKRFDQFLESPGIEPVVDKYFVIARLTVQEREDKQDLNNPGGDEVLDRVGGKLAGLPFFAFLDSNGATVVNSIKPGKSNPAQRNIGHPVQPDEIDWFMKMLKQAAPAISAAEAKPLEDWLRAQKK